MIEKIKNHPFIVGLGLFLLIGTGFISYIVIAQIILEREVQKGLDNTNINIDSLSITGYSVVMKTIDLSVNLSVNNPYDVTAKVDPFTIDIDYYSNLLSIMDIPEIIVKGKSKFLILNSTLKVIEDNISVFIEFFTDYLDDGQVAVNITGIFTIHAPALFVTISATKSINMTITIES